MNALRVPSVRLAAVEARFVGLAVLLTALLPALGAAQSQAVVWRNAAGVTVSGSDLTKTAAGGWGNAGAVSTQTLESGGYVEFSTSETNKQQMIGLGAGDSDQSYTDIEYAIFLSNGSLQVYEAGAAQGSFGSYTTSDRFRVEVALGKARSPSSTTHKGEGSKRSREASRQPGHTTVRTSSDRWPPARARSNHLCGPRHLER
jgi:hypothetical protein